MENKACAPFSLGNLRGSDVIRTASGGLALRGIFLSKDPQELSKERKKVLEVPQNVELTTASKSPQDLVMQFESLREEQNFQQCIHRTGLNISGKISATVWGCGVKFKTGLDSSQHSDKIVSSSGEAEYASITKYSSIPMASCDLNARELRLSPFALDSLKQLQNALRYESSDEKKHQRCADFLYSYGSHVNCCTIVLGGIFEMKAEISKYKKSEKSSIFQMLSDVLRTSASVTKIVEFDMGITATSSSCVQGNSYASEQLKNTTVSIKKLGGLATASDLTEWKKSLLSQPETWHVIDWGSLDELLPVWEILKNHVNDLEDSDLLAQNLRKCWEKETNLLNRHPEDRLLYSLKEMEKKVASIRNWNNQSEDTFLKNCEQYLSECQRLKLSLMCPDTMWYEEFLCDAEVQHFFESAAQCIDHCENKTYLTLMTYSLLEPVELIQVTKFPSIAKILRQLNAAEEEVTPWCLTLEGAMKSVRETKINFLKVDPENTEKIRQLSLRLYRTIDALLRNLKEKQKYADALVTGILILPFHGPQENPKYSLTKKDLETVLCQMAKIESILEILYNLNDTQCQAFLIYMTLKGFRETGWEEQDCNTGVKIICSKLGEEISPEIKRVVFTEHGNIKHDIEMLEEEMVSLYKNELPASTRKATEQKKELVQFLNSLDQTECTDPECQSSEANSDSDQKPELLQQLQRSKYYPGKLSLRDVLDLRPDSFMDHLGIETDSIIWTFIKKVLMSNSTARKAVTPPGKDVHTETEIRQAEESELLDVEELFKDEEQCTENSFHPLDITVMSLLCSDQLLRQEIVSKMAMCQFAVPLLLPKGFRKEVSFLLWTLRSIVKKWTPQSLIPSKGFIEDNLVAIKMPTVSFVRLGPCTESKSRILNEVLSDGQLSFFVNRHMEQGDIKRQMSDGVAEICWHLPSGNATLDAFSEAFSVINLRGDAFQHSAQLCFLAEVSAATFVFIDKIGKEEKEFIASHSSSLQRSKLFLVMNVSEGDKCKTSKENLKSLIKLLQLKKDQFVQFGKSSTDILKHLRERVANEVMQSVKTHRMLFSLEEMADVAKNHGIFVDEDEDHLKKVKTTVKEMMEILDSQSVMDFKKDNLHYQGEQWKTWSKVDKEQSRLKHRGAEPFSLYIDRLEVKKKGLRKQQLGFKVSTFMTKFIEQIHSQDNSKLLFIQWLKLEMDSRSRKNLKALRNAYKNICENTKLSSEDDTLKNIDRKISESSLGLEHLLREVGQIYEATTSYTTLQERSHYQQLPRYAAQLMLGGVPLELIDGDASNIPLQWVTNVLEEIVNIVGKERRMLVVTVLGVQSTGKSTLLNTMFGLQFAVSSGRCTRGAFMQLLGVKGDLKEKLGCDFVMVIDTEGLKAQELAHLDDSYEHDNELATLVTGLSDLTLVNVSTENSTEMKDTLQIVVHAFIRMKEVGKRPNCQFIHQNAGDITAHENNVRDRRYFLDQLNEMTKAAARMEERERLYSSFGDVMEYDSSKSNWYIGSLWHGNPPMAAVNTGYCKNITDLKKHIVNCLEQRQHKPGSIHDFGEWLKNIWAAVKKENFIFSFRNSLIAEAYNQLSLQYCDWEWELREFIMSWTQESENKIKNSSQTELSNLLSDLEFDLNAKVTEKIDSCMEKLREYFSSGKDNVHLVEGYKAEFLLSLQALSTELKNSTIGKCSDTVSRQKGLQKLIHIQRGYQQQIETEVNSLLMSCKKQKRELQEKELESAFEDMWREVTSTFPNSLSGRSNVACDMQNALWKNLQAHSYLIPENLNLIKEDHLSTFKVKSSHVQFKSFWKGMAPERVQHHFMHLPEQAQAIFVHNIRKIIDDKVKENINYDQNFCLEILREVDWLLKNHEDDSFKFTDSFKTDFKLHVSGYAVKQFEEMQDRFYRENDPVEKLGRQKVTYLEIFKDTYCKKDQTHKKAEMFCAGSLKPAFVECIKSKLGATLLEDLRCNRKSLALSTSKFFHASLLVHLMEAGDFNEYYRYINHYEDYATEWVKKCVFKHCADQTNDGKIKIVGLASNILKQLSHTAKEAIKDAVTCTISHKISDFIELFVKKMDRELVIPTDNLDLIAFQSDGNLKAFADAVLIGVNDLEKAVEYEIGRWDVENCISELPRNPTEELIKSLLNCKKQCPFCAVPCERAGLNHSNHFSEYHIPDGLAGYSDITSKKLSTLVCTVSVSSGETFRNEDTDYKYVAYKDYKTVNEFYKSWQIQSDSSYEATSYWKSVFYKFNRDFAKKYGAEPSDIPEGWNISKEQVRKDLEKTYQVSLNSIE